MCVPRGLACVTSQTCSAGRIAKSAEPGRGQIFVAPGLGFAEKRAPSVDIHLPIIKLYLKYLYIIIYIDNTCVSGRQTASCWAPN